MSRFFTLLSLLGGSFIIWVIYLANTGSPSFFFEFVRRIPYGDKVGHFCLFGTLTLFIVAASGGRTCNLVGVNLFVGSLLVVAFVTMEEISQLFIQTRTFDVYDWLADLAGIIIASCLYKVCRLLRTASPPWNP